MRLKYKHAQIDALMRIVTTGITFLSPERKDVPDTELLIRAVLEELQLKIAKKLVERKKNYTINLSPAEGFAIRVMFASPKRGTFEENLIGRICDDVNRIYSNRPATNYLITNLNQLSNG